LPLALAIFARVCDAQPAPKSGKNAVVLYGDNNRDLYFFPSEPLFDFSCRVLRAGHVSAADVKVLREGAVKITAGTHALELSRNDHFARVQNGWIGKVRIRLISGPRKGEQGFVFAKWVLPDEGSPATKSSPIVSIYGTIADITYLFKSRTVFDLAVRGTAGKTLTHEEQDIIVHGVYKLKGRTHARLISSKDKIPTPDGRFVGYSFVELADGPYKGQQGFVFIDQVHK
jgi:hypothetical protein